MLPPRLQRTLWLVAGVVALATGIVGAFLPVLPTTPFVLLAAWCFTRSSPRLERRLLEHPRFGPMIHDWRAHRAVPLRAKQFAWFGLALGSAWAWWLLPQPWRWAPAGLCLVVAVWMWSLPTAAAASRRERPAAAAGAPGPRA